MPSFCSSSVCDSSILAGCFLQSVVSGHAALDEVHHLAEVDVLIADDLIVLIQRDLGDVAVGQLQITRSLRNGAVGGSDHGTGSLAQVLKAGADLQAILGECALSSAVDDLKEELSHGGVDSVADKVCVQGFENGKSGEDLRCHSCRVGHSGTSEGLHQSFLDDAVLDVQGQLAGTLLRCAPAHTMCVTGNVLNLFCLHPLCFLRDRSGTVMHSLCDRAHVLDFC